MPLFRRLALPALLVVLSVVACLPDNRQRGDDDDVGADCFTDFDCSEGEEYCKADDPSSSPEGVCQGLEAAGDPCVWGSQCISGLFCLVDNQDDEGQCQAAPSSCEDGPACNCDPMLEMCAAGGLSCDGSGDSVTLHCNNGPRSGGGDDDDTAVGDDDSFPGDDDSVPGDDDDDTLPPLNLPTCTGPTVTFAEVEPNNEEAEVNVITGSDGDLMITGTTSDCANDGQTWAGDIDLFSIEYGCMGDATFTLEWTGSDNDMDYNVLASAFDDQAYAAVGYEFSTTSPEEMSASGVGGPMVIQVMCWEGAAPQSWTFSIDWDSAP
jgi:hypothetical protein